MYLIVRARAVRATSSQAILSTCGSRYSIGSWLAAFHGNTLSSPIYYIHMVISISYYSPFPYSFGSRVGYYSIHCYLAPVSVSPDSVHHCFWYSVRSIHYCRLSLNSCHNAGRLLFRCSHRSRRLACSFKLLSRLVLRKAHPTCKPTFNVWRFFNLSICLQSLSVLRCRLAPAVCLALSLLSVFIPTIEAAKGIEP